MKLMTMQESFFESYNKANEAAYEAYFSHEKDILKAGKESAARLDSCIESEIAKWNSTSLTALGGVTPAEYVNTISGLDDLIDMFRTGSAICDDKLPEVFLCRLQSFGEAAEDALLELCQINVLPDVGGESSSQEAAEDVANITVTAVNVLGQWKSVKAVEPLLELLKYTGPIGDLLFESVKAALVSIGEPSAEKIVIALEAGELGAEALEQLVMALAEIGSMNRSDSYYRSLKNAFLRQPFKATAAASLAAYGDGRAIPALRGYIEKNGSSLDKNTLYEIITAIRSLGGRTDDLGIKTGEYSMAEFIRKLPDDSV